MIYDLNKLVKHLHDTTLEKLAEKEIMENAELIKAALNRGETYSASRISFTEIKLDI